jgi:hypothetical protein
MAPATSRQDPGVKMRPDRPVWVQMADGKNLAHVGEPTYTVVGVRPDSAEGDGGGTDLAYTVHKAVWCLSSVTNGTAVSFTLPILDFGRTAVTVNAVSFTGGYGVFSVTCTRAGATTVIGTVTLAAGTMSASTSINVPLLVGDLLNINVASGGGENVTVTLVTREYGV